MVKKLLYEEADSQTWLCNRFLINFFTLLFNSVCCPTRHRVKGTVQRELRGDKIGINRTARINCIAGKCHLPCPKGHHHERSLNVIGGCSTFWRHPNRVSNISQRQNNFVDFLLQHRLVLKNHKSLRWWMRHSCEVKWSCNGGGAHSAPFGLLMSPKRRMRVAHARARARTRG